MTEAKNGAGVPAEEDEEAIAAPSPDEDEGEEIACEPMQKDTLDIFEMPVEPLSFSEMVIRRRKTRTGQTTEQLLNGLIDECHFLMQEVALRTICQATNANERMRLMDTTMQFARTGAAVADAVGRLRNGGAPPASEFHQRVTVERVEKLPQGGGGKDAR